MFLVYFCAAEHAYKAAMSKKELVDFEIYELSEFWELLTEEQRYAVRKNHSIQFYKKNEIIYSEGDEARNIMCLLKGKVKIYKEGVGGRSQIIRMIRPVQYFGYRAFFATEPYVTSAAAFESSTVVFIPMEVICRFVEENNKIAMFLIRELSVDLGIADERTVTLTQKHIRGRLAEALLVLKDKYGYEEDNLTLSIFLSREDLAGLSNMTTSNAIRTLSNFATEKLIIVDGRKILILDEEKLRRISRIG